MKKKFMCGRLGIALGIAIGAITILYICYLDLKAKAGAVYLLPISVFGFTSCAFSIIGSFFVTDDNKKKTSIMYSVTFVSIVITILLASLYVNPNLATSGKTIVVISMILYYLTAICSLSITVLFIVLSSRDEE